MLLISLLPFFLIEYLLFKVVKPDTGKEEKRKTIGKLTLLQLNIWVECTGANAVQGLIYQIAGLKPDVATFCELYKGRIIQLCLN